MINPWEEIMFPEESRGQSQQNQRLGQITHHAQVKESVAVICLWAETESAAFVRMDHESGEEKFGNCDRFPAVQTEFAGYRFRRDQLFQGNAEISQLAQFEPV